MLKEIRPPGPRDIRKGCTLLISPEYAVEVPCLHVMSMESKLFLPPFAYAAGKPGDRILLR